MQRSFGPSSLYSAQVDQQATLPAEPTDSFRPAKTAGPHSLPLGIDLWTLARFKELMSAEGWPVQTARMIFDRVYAHERLAFGHTSASADLRALSLDIFRRMHAEDGLPH